MGYCQAAETGAHERDSLKLSKDLRNAETKREMELSKETEIFTEIKTVSDNEKEEVKTCKNNICDELEKASLENENNTNIIDESDLFSVSLNDFSFMKTLGKGAFGEVHLTRKKSGDDKGSLYALKVIHKVKVETDRNYEDHFKSEREALEMVRDGPFVSKMYFAFQTNGHLFIAMDYNTGGQVLHQFVGKNILLIPEVKIYLAELLVAVDYLHQRGIIHRDIKPENILLDSTGHIVLIDFGLSKITEGSLSESYVGTEPYIAPEIIKRQPHDHMADLWSVGVLGYEMVAGEPPFDTSLSDDNLRKAVLSKEPRYPPKQFQKLCKSFLSGLLNKNPKLRLGAVTKSGSGGMQAVMGHKFFSCINWSDVSARKLKPPVTPKEVCVKELNETDFVEPVYGDFRCHFSNFNYSWLHDKESKPSRS